MLFRSEAVTNCDHLRSLKFSSVRPWAFTEHGAIMAASVLNSPRAVEMSVFVVRAFLRLRVLASTYAQLAAKLDALERQVAGHDTDIKAMFSALRGLIEPPRKPHRQIGFTENRRKGNAEEGLRTRMSEVESARRRRE